MPPKIVKSAPQTEDILKRMEEIYKATNNKLDSTRSDIESKMNNGFSNLESKVDGLIENFRSEIVGEITKIRSDVEHCYSVIKEVDKSSSAKVNALIIKNNVLERRLNRSDILIMGLPNKMDKIREYVIKIAQLVDVNITLSDINHCCYIKSRKCILAKFNSVYLRDTIMKNYYKSSPLFLKAIVGSDIVENNGRPENVVEGSDGVTVNGAVALAEPRVFLKDNLCPSSRKLQFICQKLLLQQKIKKFYLKNMDNPKAKVFKPDGSSVYLDIQQCADLLDSVDENAIGVQRKQK